MTNAHLPHPDAIDDAVTEALPCHIDELPARVRSLAPSEIRDAVSRLWDRGVIAISADRVMSLTR